MKRFELQGEDVLLYFDEINSLEEYCVAVEVQAVFEVYDAIKANVKIYDYYHPEYQQSVAYHLSNHNGTFFVLFSCTAHAIIISVASHLR